MNTTHIEVTTDKGNKIIIPIGMIIIHIVNDGHHNYGEVGYVGGSENIWSVTLDEAMRIRNILIGDQK